ncbi:MAG: stage II sporulation protein M, partial [Candidatus Dormibacteria bacterium]
MREAVFVARSRERWDALAALVARARAKGIGALAGDELDRLASLYRAAASDLSAARGRGYSEALVAYLNDLVGAAYALVFFERAPASWDRIAGFFARDFPREVRRSRGPILACAALFVAAWLTAYALVAHDPPAAYALLPASEIPLVQRSLHDSNFAFDRTDSPAVASAIITNNVSVTLLAIAGGATLGVLTLWAILGNGLMLGGLGALYAHAGFGLDFWATIVPHGTIELTSIQIAGGAGLLIAQAALAPGRRRRADALRANA